MNRKKIEEHGWRYKMVVVAAWSSTYTVTIVTGIVIMFAGIDFHCYGVLSSEKNFASTCIYGILGYLIPWKKISIGGRVDYFCFLAATNKKNYTQQILWCICVIVTWGKYIRSCQILCWCWNWIWFWPYLDKNLKT